MDLSSFLDQYSQVRTVLTNPDSERKSIATVFEIISILCQYLTVGSELITNQVQSLDSELPLIQSILTTNATMAEIVQTIRSLVSFQTIIDQPMVESQDKFFWVTLTSQPSHGSASYITQRLIKSFHSMAPPAYPATAKAFVIGPDLTLYGLIRFNRSQSTYCISTKSSHFRNEIRSETSGILYSNPFTVVNLTKYQSKRYCTFIADILEKYEFMRHQGNIMGVDFSKMIESD